MIRVRSHIGDHEATVVFEGADPARSASWWLPAGEAPSAARLGDVAAVTALLPAMAMGRDLDVVDRHLDPTLERNLARVQDVFVTWSTRKHRVTGRGPTYVRIGVGTSGAAAEDVASSPPGGRRGTALMFSGGVDSFHSALACSERLDAMVFVHGLDVRLDDPARQEVAGQVRSAAAALGLPLVEVATDVRRLTDPVVAWEDTHGAALAAVGHLLGDRFHTVIVPATHTYDALYPLGSHPLVDPLWSSSTVSFETHGADADRVAKMAAIASSPVARRWLRVCPRYEGGTENCGRCEKCLRTMAAARLAGAERAFATLPPLRGAPALLRVASTRTKGRATTWQGYWEVTRQEVRDPALRWATGIALVRHHVGDTRRRRASRRT